MFEEREVVILVVIGGEGEFFFRWMRNLVVIAKAVRAAAERSIVILGHFVVLVRDCKI